MIGAPYRCRAYCANPSFGSIPIAVYRFAAQMGDELAGAGADVDDARALAEDRRQLGITGAGSLDAAQNRLLPRRGGIVIVLAVGAPIVERDIGLGRHRVGENETARAA